ncbi:hypothetical protein SISSUDRAFT_1065534 [Sistotremastrum suecicum HHB10207 ss-3]|uniref:Uncharacterized protein n=1 Tax=Sistotremastrum suecicum HHB10207 ss-3 TaxID=1314776 RepID=A0A165ZC59_9AGAM|nr:hypothetical protein SISSUDRAFT_1065534 [Sistotremastrum suecicum HHB10207 ss-3]
MPLEGHLLGCRCDPCLQLLPRKVTDYAVPHEFLNQYHTTTVSDLNNPTQKVSDYPSETMTRTGYQISAADSLDIYKRGVLKTPETPMTDRKAMYGVVRGVIHYLRETTGLSVEKQFMWETQSYLIYLEPTHKNPNGRSVPVPDLETWGNMLAERLPILLGDYEVREREEEKSIVVESAAFMQLCLDEGLLGDVPDGKEFVRIMLASALSFPVAQDSDDEDE